MKYAAVLLLAFVAVSQAAFTANLVKDAQPSLAQAMFKVRLAASSNKADGFQTDLVAQLQAHANDLLNQIQNTVAAGQEVASNVYNQFQETTAQLAALGSNILQNGQGILSNFFGNIWGHLFGNRSAFGNAVNFIQNFNVNSMLQSVADYATNLVSQLDLGNLLTNVLNAILPDSVAALLGFKGSNKGIFSDAWNAVSGAGSAAWGHITDLASNIFNVASGAFSNVQQVAMNFINEATSNAAQITGQAATQFLDFLRPYQQDLGALYDQVVAQVNQIIG